MTFTDNFETLKAWMPLMMEGRSQDERIAATKIESGTDVNFGNLTRSLLSDLKDQGVELNYNHSVQNIRRNEDNSWQLKIYNAETKRSNTIILNLCLLAPVVVVYHFYKRQA